MKLKRFLRNFFDGLGAVLVFAACVGFAYHWDPTRIYYKRLKAYFDPYRYEEIDPRLAPRDPDALIGIRDRSGADAVRTNIVKAIWGPYGYPVKAQPDAVVRDFLNPSGDAGAEACGWIRARYPKLVCMLDIYRKWRRLARLDQITVQITPDLVAKVAVFWPVAPKGTLVLFQEGYANTYHDQHRILEWLVAAGYTVAALNMPGYGDSVGMMPDMDDNPLRSFFTPPVVTINHVLAQGGVDRVAMVGLSAGGWITTALSAVDQRIRRSYSIAGVVPAYQQRGREWPLAQQYPPFVEAASILDLFVLGASPRERKQWQIYNRFDRCCYEGLRSLLWDAAVTDAVRRAGGGRFEVHIDETHARHKISRWALDRIIEDLDAWGSARKEGPNGRE